MGGGHIDLGRSRFRVIRRDGGIAGRRLRRIKGCLRVLEGCRGLGQRILGAGVGLIHGRKGFGIDIFGHRRRRERGGDQAGLGRDVGEKPLRGGQTDAGIGSGLAGGIGGSAGVQRGLHGRCRIRLAAFSGTLRRRCAGRFRRGFFGDGVGSSLGGCQIFGRRLNSDIFQFRRSILNGQNNRRLLRRGDAARVGGEHGLQHRLRRGANGNARCVLGRIGIGLRIQQGLRGGDIVVNIVELGGVFGCRFYQVDRFLKGRSLLFDGWDDGTDVIVEQQPQGSGTVSRIGIQIETQGFVQLRQIKRLRGLDYGFDGGIRLGLG